MVDPWSANQSTQTITVNQLQILNITSSICEWKYLELQNQAQDVSEKMQTGIKNIRE